MSRSYYRVRLGEKARLAAECFDGGFIGVHWGFKQDLTGQFGDSWKDFNARFRPEFLERNPEKTMVAAGLACGMLWNFGAGMTIGDVVMCPDANGDIMWGEITSDYYCVPTANLPQQRKVKWFAGRSKRSELSETLKGSTNGPGTIVEINQYADEIERLIGREVVPAVVANARITARSDEAVEGAWRETADALSAAETRVSAFEREVAVLTRLTQALEAARSGARDLYLKPVMSELRPLLGLLFDDVTITFDDRTLLPQTIVRAGLQEDVDRPSGGMREQLSVLTRLAFARLLARDGRPAPVILDDALVYSDDDRIERMFDALHRQARDQQIIVFSCRQRAFQSLGGNVLQMTDWQP